MKGRNRIYEKWSDPKEKSARAAGGPELAEQTEGDPNITHELILRQHKWLKERLEQNERLMAYSQRKPAKVTAGVWFFIGAVMLLSIPQFIKQGYILGTVAVAAAGAAAAFLGYRCLSLVCRECVYVTNGRLAHRRINIWGRLQDETNIPVRDIERCRLIRSCISGTANTPAGDIVLNLKNGKTASITSMEYAEHIAEAIRSLIG